jgi:hypothetical protein
MVETQRTCPCGSDDLIGGSIYGLLGLDPNSFKPDVLRGSYRTSAYVCSKCGQIGLFLEIGPLRRLLDQRAKRLGFRPTDVS